MSNPKNGSSGGPILVRDNSGGASNPLQILGYLEFPATVNVAQPAGLADAQASQLSLDANGNLRMTPGSGVTFTFVPFNASSVAATGRVVAPAAGQVIASIAAGSVPAGTYNITVNSVLDVGAPAAADANNMQLMYGATVLLVLQVDISGLTHPNQQSFQLVAAGGSVIQVQAIGAGTAGVGYNAQIVATRVA